MDPLKRVDGLLLLAFGFANSVLYSSLLPLWEGFDEPWHYGYLQYLDTSHKPPVFQQTHLCEDIWRSMLLSPASHIVQRTVPEVQTFDSYFKLTESVRRSQRDALKAIPANQCVAAIQLNYEAQQAPLAYVLLSGPDLLLSRASIPVRILRLRILIATVSVLGTFFAASLLFRTLALPSPYQALGVFCVFACQMYWATVAHIGNDGFSLPLTVWFFAETAAFSKQPGVGRALRLALVVSLGLLTKAYFLPLSIFAMGLVAYRYFRALPYFAAMIAVLAGPWYLRNLLLYRTLSGLMMTSTGVTTWQAILSLAQVDWSRSILYMLRATLWTGNYSFTSFSSNTLNCLLSLLAAGAVMYAVHAFRRRSPNAIEWTVLGGIAIYAAAVIYVVGNDVLFQHGTSAGAAPWYTIVLLVPALSIVLLGMSRTRRLGRLAAILTGLLSGYICIATYVVKLIPLYGGYPQGRTTLKETAAWYLSNHRELGSMLSTISLAPPAAIYLETGVVAALAIALLARLVSLIVEAPSRPR
jgi:hypothetical protein